MATKKTAFPAIHIHIDNDVKSTDWLTIQKDSIPNRHANTMSVPTKMQRFKILFKSVRKAILYTLFLHSLPLNQRSMAMLFKTFNASFAQKSLIVVRPVVIFSSFLGPFCRQSNARIRRPSTRHLYFIAACVNPAVERITATRRRK